MSTIADKLNRELREIFDTGDDIYKALVADPDGTPEVTIVNPADYNIGAMANLLEYNRELSKCLIDQLDFNLQTGIYLTLTVHELLGEFRYEGETDAQMVARIQGYILDYKVSRTAIILGTTKFSTPGTPEILRCSSDIMYCDVGYCDSTGAVFEVASGDFQGEFVTPGYTSLLGSGTPFCFRLILENTTLAQLPELADVVDRWVASGIQVIIEIEYV